MDRSFVSSIILGREVRLDIFTESLTGDFEFDMQIKDFHREILAHVLPNTEPQFAKLCIHGFDCPTLLARHQKRVEHPLRPQKWGNER